MNRRSFSQRVTAASLAICTSSLRTADSPATVSPLNGIHIAGHSLLDEGMERCLDLVQSTCRANALFGYSHSYYAAPDLPPAPEAMQPRAVATAAPPQPHRAGLLEGKTLT